MNRKNQGRVEQTVVFFSDWFRHLYCNVYIHNISACNISVCSTLYVPSRSYHISYSLQRYITNSGFWVSLLHCPSILSGDGHQHPLIALLIFTVRWGHFRRVIY